MYYGIYKNVRDCAWKCFIDFEITYLPVDVLKITAASGIKVIKNSDVNDLNSGELGKAYFDGTQWFIIYDDTQSVEVCRFTVAHELGHIFLGHVLTHAQYANVQEFGKKSKAEDQADKFAQRLLCPACVLAELDAVTDSDIMNLCKVPMDVAKKRAARLKVLLERNKFFTSDLETKVFEKFKPYIEQEKQNKNK